MKFFYGYEVSAYNEMGEDIEEYYGLICANSYQEATEDLVTMYGEDNLEKFSIELLNWDFSTFEVSKSTYEALKVEAKERIQ